MSTPEQISANRANSQESTGPKTEAGKAASSQNSFKHGLFGAFRVLATEDQNQYDLLLRQMVDEHKPATPTESILVESLAQHHWLRYRAIYFQHHYIQSEDGMDTAKLNLFMRYETMHERAFYKCLTELQKLRAEQRKQEIGFVTQTQKDELHALRVRRLEGEADYQQVRVSSVRCDIYCQEKRLESAIARENHEVQTQKAA